MTRSELDKVSAGVGGMIHLVDMLTQITRALHCPLVRSLAERTKGPDSLYDFFADGPGDPPAGYYLYIDEDTDPALAAYDTLNLVYGYCAEVQAGEGYTFPFIKCADRRYALIKLEEYTGNIH
ncbi:hypothetical protein [Rubritalea profundi]|uniref:Uncharacterized protein n=1 Tax=Rubritalea profundi TaxID=1658618 RepID=A0A2S7TXE8_9BACT|nr:hypothetical protein [Rubritalea profundi]PQJ27426.1 hypothetical protein BSZ32_02215 [Rubritalea profundi]